MYGWRWKQGENETHLSWSLAQSPRDPREGTKYRCRKTRTISVKVHTNKNWIFVCIYKKIGLHVPIILFRKNQITYNFYTFVSEIKHETSKATEAEIKVISTTTGISKLSKTLLKKNSRLSQQYNNVLSYQKTIVYSMYPVQIGLCLSTSSINLLTSAKPCDFFLSISL